MKKRLHRLIIRPVFQLVGLASLVVVLGTLLIVVNQHRILAHSAALPIPASEAAAIVRSGQARSIEVQLDHAYLSTDSAEYVFIKDRETSVPQMLAGLGVGSAERPGRFDRQVTLANPDVKERTAILGVHARGKCPAPVAAHGEGNAAGRGRRAVCAVLLATQNP